MPDRNASADSADIVVGSVAPVFELRTTFEETVTRKPGRPMVVAFYVFDFGAY